MTDGYLDISYYDTKGYYSLNSTYTEKLKATLVAPPSGTTRAAGTTSVILYAKGSWYDDYDYKMFRQTENY